MVGNGATYPDGFVSTNETRRLVSDSASGQINTHQERNRPDYESWWAGNERVLHILVWDRSESMGHENRMDAVGQRRARLTR